MKINRRMLAGYGKFPYLCCVIIKLKEYGKYLSNDIINAFTGIEGRIIERFFVTSSKNNYELVKHAIIKAEDKLREIVDYEFLLGNLWSS